MNDVATLELVTRLQSAAQNEVSGAPLGENGLADLILQAADALEATLWMPIDDMPNVLKDGRGVLVWRPECEHHKAHAGVDIFDNGSDCWYRSRPMAQPTHYKPLTAPEVE